MSSESWKARPSASPYCSSTSRASAGASDSIPPSRHDVAISAPVFRADDVEVVGLGLLDPSGGLDLADLAVAERRDRPGEERADVGPEVGRDLGGLGEQVVAGEDRDGVAPAGVRRLHRVARVRLVDHVVVVQRRLVDELDRDRAGDQPRVRVGRRSSRRAARASGGTASRRPRAGTGRSRPACPSRPARPSPARPRPRRDAPGSRVRARDRATRGPGSCGGSSPRPYRHPATGVAPSPSEHRRLVEEAHDQAREHAEDHARARPAPRSHAREP